MRKSFTRRLSLASIGLIWLVGCAHQKAATTCTSCQQNHVAGAVQASPATVVASSNFPVWLVVRDTSGSPNKFVRVHTDNTPATVAARPVSPYGASLPPLASSIPAETATKEKIEPTTSLKSAINPSPFNANPVAVAVASPSEAKIPPQALAVKAEAATTEQPALILPTPSASPAKTEIAANPNLKPGMKEIVRDNVSKTYAHADDYVWVMGELEYHSTKKVWRVRYARYDENDKYGGCFTLVDADDKLEKFQSGDMVKVDGYLLDLENRQASPDYKASEILPLVTREVVDVKIEEKK